MMRTLFNAFLHETGAILTISGIIPLCNRKPEWNQWDLFVNFQFNHCRNNQPLQKAHCTVVLYSQLNTSNVERKIQKLIQHITQSLQHPKVFFVKTILHSRHSLRPTLMAKWHWEDATWRMFSIEGILCSVTFISSPECRLSKRCPQRLNIAALKRLKGRRRRLFRGPHSARSSPRKRRVESQHWKIRPMCPD